MEHVLYVYILCKVVNLVFLIIIQISRWDNSRQTSMESVKINSIILEFPKFHIYVVSMKSYASNFLVHSFLVVSCELKFTVIYSLMVCYCYCHNPPPPPPNHGIGITSLPRMSLYFVMSLLLITFYITPEFYKEYIYWCIFPQILCCL
jgi:hypothetical protein